MRKIMITGHLAANAEKLTSKNGREYLQFRIANNEYGDEKETNGNSKPFWVRVTSFVPSIISMSSHLTKGKPIIVTGRYSDNTYMSKATGTCEISREIIAESIEYLPGGGSRNDNNENNVDTPVTQTSVQPTTIDKTSTVTPTSEVVIPSNDDTDDLPF